MSRTTLTPTRVRKSGMSRSVTMATVIKHFKSGIYFMREGVKDAEVMVNKDDFDLGEVVLLRFGKDLSGLVSYRLIKKDIASRK